MLFPERNQFTDQTQVSVYVNFKSEKYDYISFMGELNSGNIGESTVQLKN